MKRFRLLVAAAVGALALTACTEDRAERAAPSSSEAVWSASDEVVVDLVDGSELSELLERFPELDPADVRWNSPNVADEAIAVIDDVATGEQAALIAQLRGAGDLVESAEHNGVYAIEPPSLSGPALLGRQIIPDDEHFDPRDEFPNDPLYGQQWNMEMVAARDAWRYATGEDVIVAVIDTGVAYEDEKGLWAPDLKRTRFVAGYDFVNDDAIAADDHGHGSHCAGTIAQSTDNEIGVIGLAHESRIMPLKVLSKHGFGTASDIADAIRWAADHGADVLSLSLGGGGYSQVMADAVRYAADRGCAVVCAAGNGGRGVVEYPAAYPGAIAVSSVGPEGKLAFYSSYGKQTFIAAPGGEIKAGQPERGVLQNTLDPRRPGKTGYAYFQGTSMATPHVAGAAALLYEAGVNDPDAVRSILAGTAAAPGDSSHSGWSQKYGHGVLDAGAAVRHAIFVPGFIALGLAVLGCVVAVRRTTSRDLVRGLLFVGAVMGACGLFFLRPLGLGEVPLVGPLLTRSMADWDIALMGASWHWFPLFASAMIPAFLGLVTVKSRVLRSLTVGIALGWAARLATGVVLPYADVKLIPGHGILDAAWLGANAVFLLLAVAVFVRLGRGKDQAVEL